MADLDRSSFCLNRAGRKLLRLYGGLFAAMTLLPLAGLGALTYHELAQRSRWNRWTPRTGHVSRIEHLGDDCYRASFAYHYAGSEYEGTACGPGAPPVVGQRVSVRVDPNRPKDYVSEPSCDSVDVGLWVAASVICGIFALCGVLGLLELRRMRHLLRHGQATLFDQTSPGPLYYTDGAGRRRKRAPRFFPTYDAIAWSLTGSTRPAVLLTEEERPRRCYLVRQSLLEPASASASTSYLPALPVQKALRPGFSSAALGLLIGVSAVSSTLANARGNPAIAFGTLGAFAVLPLTWWIVRRVRSRRALALSATAARQAVSGCLSCADELYLRAAHALPRHSIEHQTVVFSLAAVALRQGNLARALGLFYAAEQHAHPDPAGAFAGHVGLAYALLNKPTQARYWLKRARQRASALKAVDKSVWVGEALTDCRTGRYDDCVTRLRPHAQGQGETAGLARLLIALAEYCATGPVYRGPEPTAPKGKAASSTAREPSETDGRAIDPEVAVRYEYLGATWPALAALLDSAIGAHPRRNMRCPRHSASCPTRAAS